MLCKLLPVDWMKMKSSLVSSVRTIRQSKHQLISIKNSILWKSTHAGFNSFCTHCRSDMLLWNYKLNQIKYWPEIKLPFFQWSWLRKIVEFHTPYVRVTWSKFKRWRSRKRKKCQNIPNHPHVRYSIFFPKCNISCKMWSSNCEKLIIDKNPVLVNILCISFSLYYIVILRYSQFMIHFSNVLYSFFRFTCRALNSF